MEKLTSFSKKNDNLSKAWGEASNYPKDTDTDVVMRLVFPYNDKEGVKDVEKVLHSAGYDVDVLRVEELDI